MNNQLNKATRYHRKQITHSDVFSAFDRVWKTESIKEMIDEKDEAYIKKEIRSVLCSKVRTIVWNINHIKKYVANKNLIKTHSDISIEDLIEKLSYDGVVKERYSNYYNEKQPNSLYKYVKREHSIETVKKGCFKCGKAIDYQKNDCNDSISILSPKTVPKNDNVYDAILEEIILDILKKKNISIEDTRHYINKKIGEFYYIGCLTDTLCEYMWKEYGTDGVCIEFDVSKMKFHKITYSDEPLKQDEIMCEFKDLSRSIMDRKDVRKSFSNYIRLIGAISLLNLYRKDESYRKESEWRLLVKEADLIKEGDKRFKKAPIVRVISNLPKKDDKKLRKYCKDNNIKYERKSEYLKSHYA